MARTRPAGIALVACLISLAAGIAFAGIKVQVDHDPSFDFTALHTWSWHPGGPGNARKIITQDDDSAAFKKQLEPRLLPMVEAALVKRGFPIAQNEQDFYVTYYVLVTVGDTEQYMGQFANLPKWGLPPMAQQTQSLKIYPRGALILDITSRAINEVVWRGVANAELKWDEDQSKRDQRIREAIEQLLKRFPPKPARKS